MSPDMSSPQQSDAMPDAAAFAALLTGLSTDMKDLLQAREAVVSRSQTAARETDRALETARTRLEEQLRDKQEAQTSEFAEREQRLNQYIQNWLERIDRIHADFEDRIREEQRASQERAKRELTAAKDRVAGDLEPRITAIIEQGSSFSIRIDELEAQSKILIAKVEKMAASHRVPLAPLEGTPAANFLEKVQDIEYAVTDAEEVLSDTASSMIVFARRCWPARLLGGILLNILVVTAHIALADYAWWLAWPSGVYIWILISLFTFLVLARGWTWLSRRRMRAAAPWLRMNVINAVKHLAKLEKTERERVAYDGTMEERLSRLSKAEENAAAETTSAQEKAAENLENLDERYSRLKDKLDGRLARELKNLKAEQARAGTALQKQHAEAMEAAAAEHVDGHARVAAERDRETRRVEDEWHKALSGFQDTAAAALASRQESNPDWDAPVWDQWPPSPEYPRRIPIGIGRVSLKGLAGVLDETALLPFPENDLVELPVALSLPEQGSLLVRADKPNRGIAVGILENTLLRILTSFPPAKAKLTIIDPVGLGQSFSAFMRLADYDETLVTSKIWTEAAHIERQLTNLTAHMEKVIQKYLRNQYETVADYNREAGVMTEAYRFLVIADFPTGFTDLALDRLAAIISSGPRCGVYTIIHQDAAQKLPGAIHASELARASLLLREEKDGFSIDREGFEDLTFAEEIPPPAPRVSALLEEVGRQASEAARIELPFSAAVPGDAEVWSLNTDEDVRIPLGRAGADRLQYLQLGRGTQQHALIGGRTGSGKSTLFHVLITTAALWYSPDEIEFYLIDFKKGVEFKRLASHRLPHARAIGIESDREFGLSVLRRVDEELTRRGELFRKAGVQNLAGYRRDDGSQILPRTLIIIDEFQEFFTEDDSVARDAALYLDRFVRQGRAFGMHIILGSQTLSGIYTLAKSTLGQMGVRIALQCNEADSHLILGEDNTAARLLSRPGEAIYNDMSGLVEGNHPFQVVWLPEDTQEMHLRTVAARAADESWKPAVPTVIFEGNAPAELESNTELQDLLAAPFSRDQELEQVWVGEASSIKGPTEIVFTPNAGSNLLIVGQHREAAFAIVASTIISLAARHQPGETEFVILTPGSGDEFHPHFENLAGAIPHGVRLVAPNEFGDLFADLTQRWEEGGKTPGSPLYLVTFGLQRLRNLRQDDDFLFSTDSEAGPAESEQFANILSEGPETKLHNIIWCDGLGNLNRTFSRKTMREFDVKILFQMSASDSSELIDDIVGNSLGLHGALLAVESDGTTEKFRPYSIPGPAVFDAVRAKLEKKFKGGS